MMVSSHVWALELSLNDALAFLIKAALGGGVLAFSDDFATNPLAASLRRMTSQEPDRVGLALLEHATDPLILQAERIKVSGIEIGSLPITVPYDQHQVAFVPIPGHALTALYVHVLGIPVLPWGVVADGILPLGKYGKRQAVVLVREDYSGLIITDAQDVILDAVAAAALKAAGEIGTD